MYMSQPLTFSAVTMMHNSKITLKVKYVQVYNSIIIKLQHFMLKLTFTNRIKLTLHHYYQGNKRVTCKHTPSCDNSLVSVHYMCMLHPFYKKNGQSINCQQCLLQLSERYVQHRTTDFIQLLTPFSWNIIKCSLHLLIVHLRNNNIRFRIH